MRKTDQTKKKKEMKEEILQTQPIKKFTKHKFEQRLVRNWTGYKKWIYS